MPIALALAEASAGEVRVRAGGESVNMDPDEAVEETAAPELDQVSLAGVHGGGTVETYLADSVLVPPTVSIGTNQKLSSQRVFGAVPFKFVTTRVCKPGMRIGEVKKSILQKKVSGVAGKSSWSSVLYFMPSMTKDSDGHP